MSPEKIAVDPFSFSTFGSLLCHLRRREKLTQRDLGIAVGYSEGHINRFEKNKRIPPQAVVAALFIPALNLAYDSDLAVRLIELAGSAPPNLTEARPDSAATFETGAVLEPIPPAPTLEIPRLRVRTEVEGRLAVDRCLVLSGLPGMGKSTIASQIARQYAQKMPVFWLTLMAGITASADVLIRQLAVFLDAIGRSEVKPLLAANPAAPEGIPLDLKLALLCSALGKQPALLCFDNAELIFIDEACLQIMRRISSTPTVYMLIISRQSLPLPAFTDVCLDGFEVEEGLAFVTRYANAAIDRNQAERLVLKTDGSPMLLRLAIGRPVNGRSETEQFISHLETQPQVLSYLFETIQKQLSPDGWRLLLLLAAFQEPLNLFDPHLAELAQKEAEINQLSEAISELQRRQLIVNAAYAQLHPLIDSYVSLSLSLDRNLYRRMHRLAGDWFWIYHQNPLSAALHYNLADLLDQAVEMIEENGIAIVGRGQTMAAVDILDEVQAKLQRLRVPPNDLLRRLLLGRGMLMAGTLRVEEGESNLRQAILLTSTPAVRAYTRSRLAEMRLMRSDFQESLELIEAARSELTSQDVLLQAQLVAMESIVYSSTGESDRALVCATEALALVDQMAGVPQALVGEIRARAQLELGNCARMQRDLKGAMRYAQAGLESARRGQNQRASNLALSFIGGLHYDLGDLDESFRCRSEGLEGLLSIGDVHSAAYLLTQLADIHYLRLEIDLALEKLDRANQTLRAVGDMRGLAAAESLRTSCLLWNGQIDQAGKVIELALEETRGKGTERLWGYRLSKLAMVQLVRGEPIAALATLNQALALPTSAGNRMMRFELNNRLALAYMTAGDPQAARRSLDEAPPFEGLSRWAEFDRDLIEGYAALACGDLGAARVIHQQLVQRACSYPLLCESARQFASAIYQSAPARSFPRLLWVKSTG